MTFLLSFLTPSRFGWVLAVALLVLLLIQTLRIAELKIELVKSESNLMAAYNVINKQREAIILYKKNVDALMTQGKKLKTAYEWSEKMRKKIEVSTWRGEDAKEPAGDIVPVHNELVHDFLQPHTDPGAVPGIKAADPPGDP